MTRPSSRVASKIVERLEREQVSLVAFADPSDQMDDLDVRSEPRHVAARQHRWEATSASRRLRCAAEATANVTGP